MAVAGVEPGAASHPPGLAALVRRQRSVRRDVRKNLGSLRFYLVVATVLVIVKVAQVALGH